MCVVISLVVKSEPTGHKGCGTILKRVILSKAELPFKRTHLKAQQGKITLLAHSCLRLHQQSLQQQMSNIYRQGRYRGPADWE